MNIKTPILLALMTTLALGMPAGASNTTEVTMGELSAPMSPMYYNVGHLEIQVGDTVRWTNVGTMLHEVEFGLLVKNADPAVRQEVPGSVVLDSDPTTPPADPSPHKVSPGGVITYTFNTPGVYTAHCNLGGGHNAAQMTIVVS
jgi:plastocyanin